jgi:pimeloyl-ACP methyl ester carboxylesterase
VVAAGGALQSALCLRDVFAPQLCALVADAIVRVVPGARVVHIADAGHSAYFERASAFNRIVSEFLEIADKPLARS